MHKMRAAVRFAWDSRKAAANLRKHGVSFTDAATAFDDELGAYSPDTLHADRFILIGYSSDSGCGTSCMPRCGRTSSV
jgi:uncharacterized DUF497 family protein